MFSSGGPSVRFLTRYDGEVSEPLEPFGGSPRTEPVDAVASLSAVFRRRS